MDRNVELEKNFQRLLSARQQFRVNQRRVEERTDRIAQLPFIHRMAAPMLRFLFKREFFGIPENPEKDFQKWAKKVEEREDSMTFSAQNLPGEYRLIALVDECGIGLVNRYIGYRYFFGFRGEEFITEGNSPNVLARIKDQPEPTILIRKNGRLPILRVPENQPIPIICGICELCIASNNFSLGDDSYEPISWTPKKLGRTPRKLDLNDLRAFLDMKDIALRREV